MGRVCLVKKKKNTWSAIVLDYYLALFSFAYVSRKTGSNKEMKLKWFQ